MKDRVIDEYLYNAMLAIRDFAGHAFAGYPEGRGREEELRLSETFGFLVKDFVDLVEASSETVDEYNERRNGYNEKVAKVFAQNP